MKLSRSQRIMKLFSSKERFASMEHESKEWGVTCSECHEFTSVWEMGGVRYLAKGNPMTRLDCPKCGEKINVSLQHQINDKD